MSPADIQLSINLETRSVDMFINNLFIYVLNSALQKYRSLNAQIITNNLKESR